MPKKSRYRASEIAELEQARKQNKNKNIERRLKALLMRAQGISRKETSLQTGYDGSYISRLCAKYRSAGLGAIVENHYSGNHRNLSYEEEAELLQPFIERGKAGQIVEVSSILLAYEKKLGRSFEKDHGRIYRVLKRHGWRKIMPRSQHPNKATDEVIEASKKLRRESMSWELSTNHQHSTSG